MVILRIGHVPPEGGVLVRYVRRGGITEIMMGVCWRVGWWRGIILRVAVRVWWSGGILIYTVVGGWLLRGEGFLSAGY